MQKYITPCVAKAVCNRADSSKVMKFWKTNFNMPVPYLFCSSSWTVGTGPLCYYGAGTSFDLTGFCPGYEVFLGTLLFHWGTYDCTTFAGGDVDLKLCWLRNVGGVCCVIAGPVTTRVTIPAMGCCTWQEQIYTYNQGVAPWEICADGTYCLIGEVCCVSGADGCISRTSLDISVTNVPPICYYYCENVGKMWIDGTCVNYINAGGGGCVCRCGEWQITGWLHKLEGVSCAGNTGSAGGQLWIPSVGLAMVGSGGEIMVAGSWSICQFCSSFSNGAPANPSPGVAYQGSIWVDDQFGQTHIALIADTGDKWLTGGGEYPYDISV